MNERAWADGCGNCRPWTAKPKRDGENKVVGPASLLELCTDAIAQHLHAIPNVVEVLPHHIMKDVLDRRKNENMADGDIPLLLATTFEVVPAEKVDFLSFKNCHKITSEGMQVHERVLHHQRPHLLLLLLLLVVPL
jgi:hypothetical protein